jgi:hypothetical protein
MKVDFPRSYVPLRLGTYLSFDKINSYLSSTTFECYMTEVFKLIIGYIAFIAEIMG